jgi:glycosyltransferase involved in cell wall biosynthesis
MNSSHQPLVSCICVTKNNSSYLARAIDCFRSQTYPEKELIILVEDSDNHVKEILEPIADPRIKCFVIPSTPKLPLGSLRNLAISKAEGEFICQWDDDDWYHGKRVEVQLNTVLKNHKPACFLAFWLIYDKISSQAYMSGLGPWPGTILCRKSFLTDKFQYPDIPIHEDWEVMISLIKNNLAYPVIMPSLYIYAYHGSNTFDHDHFQRNIFSTSQLLPPDTADLFRKIFNNDISNTEASRLILREDQLAPLDYFYRMPYVSHR